MRVCVCLWTEQEHPGDNTLLIVPGNTAAPICRILFVHILAYSGIFLTFKYAAYMHYVDELDVERKKMLGERG